MHATCQHGLSRLVRSVATFFLAVGLVVGVSPTARAQSLHELFELAAARDPSLEAARAETQAAQFRVSQSEAGRKPAYAATASATANQTKNEALVPVHVRARELQLGLQGQHALLNRADDWGVEISKRQLGLARQQEAAAVRDLVWRLTQAYVELLAARDALSAQTEARRTVGHQFTTMNRLFKAGAATVSDVRDAQARLDLAAAQEQATWGELHAKQAALDLLVGRQQVVAKPLALLGQVAQLDPGRVDDWVALAREASPEVRQSQSALDIARAELQRAKAGGQMTAAVTASLTGGYARNSTRTPVGEEQVGSSGRGPQHTAAIGLSLNLPLDAHAAIEIRQREWQAQVSRAEAQVRGAEQAAELAARQTHIGLQSLRHQLRGLEAAEQSSRMALEATERGLKAGLRVSIDVLNAQAQVFNVRRDRVKLRHEAATAWLRLRLVAGRLGPGDLAALLP